MSRCDEGGVAAGPVFLVSRRGQSTGFVTKGLSLREKGFDYREGGYWTADTPRGCRCRRVSSSALGLPRVLAVAILFFILSNLTSGGTLKHQLSSSTTTADEVVVRLTQALEQRDKEITDLRAEFRNFKALVIRVLPETSQDQFIIPPTQPRPSRSPAVPQQPTSVQPTLEEQDDEDHSNDNYVCMWSENVMQVYFAVNNLCRLRFKSIFHLLTVQQHGKGETISREEAQDPAASIQQQHAECITAGGKRSHHREGMECTVKKQSCTHMELLLPQPGVCLGLQHNRHGPTREDGEKQHPTSFQSTLMNHTERHRCCGRAPPLSLESATVA
ncbi:hypothetical protein LR48_Vigan03g044300 [Vigna angularis]|uniref:Uncharacterized protein n=1 Tax=Phaseolus angularis TaxID=3914 RepID=A0A0L9U322_PHAAN|nr:hypothetical protein LR48_Vigan03g044300 [Vigna angularis]